MRTALPLREVPTTYPFWEAPELGMGRATLASLLVTAALVVTIFELAPPRHKAPPPIVTHARMVTLPPPPPPPPEVVQPPEPLQPPPITPPPEAPAPAKIQVQKPPPKPVRRVIRHPPQHHVERQPPQPPPPQVQAPRVTNPPPPAPVQAGTDLRAYGRELHDEIQSAIEVPAAIQQLSLSGTAVVTCVVSPDGRLVSFRVSRSSGNPLIDQAALAGVRQHHFRPFVGQPATFVIPIEITGSGEQ